MALLIDGYNLLHVTGIFGRGGEGTSLHRSRQALLNFLAAVLPDRERAQTTIVFDATAGTRQPQSLPGAGSPPGLPRTIVHQEMTIHFARRYTDADEMIEELIEHHGAPQELVVVSSDHRVQRAARRRRAKTIDSDRWFAELQAAGRATDSPPGDAPAKPVGQLTPEQVAYWLEKFAQPRSDDRRNASERWADVDSKDTSPTGSDRAPPTDDGAPEITPDDDLANPFPPGYGEDLLDDVE